MRDDTGRFLSGVAFGLGLAAVIVFFLIIALGVFFS